MKKQSKLLVLILALSLLVCAAVGITASANNESPTVSIESYNVSHGGELSLYYAVNTANAGEYATVGVKLSLEPATVADRAVYEATASETLYNGEYPVFYSFGIPARNIDDVIYATPYATYADGSTVEGDEVAYSVLEYCYQMILVDADAKAEAGDITADKAAQLKSSLRSLITYAKDMMLYKDEAAASYPENHCYVAVEGGTVNGSSYLYYTEAPAEITFAKTEATPDGKIFAGWRAIYADGTSDVFAAAEDSTVVTPTASAKYSPFYLEDNNVTTFEVIDLNAGNISVADGMSITNDSVTELLGQGNRALKVSATKISATVTDSEYSKEIKASSVTTLEFDVYVPSSLNTGSAQTIATLNFLNGSTNGNHYQGVFCLAADGTLAFKNAVANTDYFVGTKDAGIYATDTWHNIRIELYHVYDSTGNYDRSNCGVKVYVDGEFAGSTYGTTNATGNNGVYKAVTNGYGTSGVKLTFEVADVYIDNVVVTEDVSGAKQFVDGTDVVAPAE